MYFGSLFMRRRKSWPVWLAVRSVLTSIMAIIVAVVVNTLASPMLAKQTSELGLDAPGWASMITQMKGVLLFVPVPGLCLGIAALSFRSLRPVLAPLAAIATLLAVMLIVGSLVAAILPMYQMPRGLGLG